MNKKQKSLLSLFYAIAISSGHEKPVDNSDVIEARNKVKPISEEDKNKRRGLSKFYYGENFVWALNQENADIKASKRGYL